MNARKSDEIRSGSSQSLVFGEQRRCFPLVDRVVATYAIVKLRNLRCYVSSYMNSGEFSDACKIYFFLIKNRDFNLIKSNIIYKFAINKRL